MIVLYKNFTDGFLVVGSFTSKTYIVMLDEQAQQAQQQLSQSGRIRVIVQDNGPIHTSKAVRKKWPEWEAQGLYLFFLPKYSGFQSYEGQ